MNQLASFSFVIHQQVTAPDPKWVSASLFPARVSGASWCNRAEAEEERLVERRTEWLPYNASPFLIFANFSAVTPFSINEFSR